MMCVKCIVELLTEWVFFGRYRSVFLGIYHTDTEGKLPVQQYRPKNTDTGCI